MNKVNKSFLLQLIITIFLVGGTIAWAWVNPTANPPGGGGAISVNSSGNVGIGTMAPGYKLEVAQQSGFPADNNLAVFRRSTDDTAGAQFNMRKSRGALASPTNIADGDLFGALNFAGYSGGTWFNTISINALVDGTFTSGQRPPSALQFYTNVANGGQTERVRIDSAGNVGIGTTAPGAKLEVAGTTKFGGIVDVVLNRIINVGNPTAGTDAVNKDYIDLKGAVGGASTRLWGEGRPNVGLKDNGTSCTNTVGGQTIKLARSDRIAYWDNASAVCPVGWWVCSAAERGTVDCSAAYTTNSHWIRCYANDLSNEYRTSDGSGAEDEPNTNDAWVSDARVMGADPAVILRAPTVGRNGIANSEFLCSILPTWCCANQ